MSSSRRRKAFGLVAFAAALARVALACGTDSHLFEGRLFVEARRCLGGSASVDVVEGNTPASACAPTCLAQPQADGARAIDVSTMCPPYPYLFDASGADPLCPDALGALTRDDTCRGDGGSTNPADAASD